MLVHINFILPECRGYSFKVDSERQILLGNLLWQLYLLSEFVADEMFFFHTFFCWRRQNWDLDRGLTFNMTIHHQTSTGASGIKRSIKNSYCVGLLDIKPGFVSQVRYQNEIFLQKIFLRRFSVNKFLAKTLRVNKPAIKKFFQKSVIRSRC